MASLTISIGAKTGTVTANNVKAQNILNDVAALFNITGTDQEKLDAIAQLIANWLVGKSQQYRTPDAVATATETIKNDVDYQWS